MGPTIRRSLVPKGFLWVALCLPLVAFSEDTARLNIKVDLRPGSERMFEEAWTVLRDRLIEQGYPFYTVVSSSGQRRHFVSVIRDAKALDAVSGYRDRLRASEDAAVQAALATLRDSVVAEETYLSRHDPILSYAPEGSYAGPYHRLQTLTFPASHRAQLEETFRALNAAWAVAEIPSAFHVIWHETEAEALGEVTLLTSASTPREFAEKDARVRAAVGEAYRRFDAMLWDLVEEIRTRYWLSQPQLTLKPPAV